MGHIPPPGTSLADAMCSSLATLYLLCWQGHIPPPGTSLVDAVGTSLAAVDRADQLYPTPYLLCWHGAYPTAGYVPGCLRILTLLTWGISHRRVRPWLMLWVHFLLLRTWLSSLALIVFWWTEFLWHPPKFQMSFKGIWTRLGTMFVYKNYLTLNCNRILTESHPEMYKSFWKRSNNKQSWNHS